MTLEIVLLIVIFAVLFGLAHSTENILNIRQRRRDEGEDVTTFL